jgi:hypothetical protein
MSLLVLGPNSQAAPGTTIGLGCQRCELLVPCGGTTDFDCFAACCGDFSRCTLACPRSDGFVTVLQDGEGISINRPWNIRYSQDDLPAYVPNIHNGSSRSTFLPSSYVALTTFDVAAPNAVRRLFRTPLELRQHFRIAPDAKVLLVSIAKDNRLEHHWRFAEERNLAEYLAQLGISHLTAPNFSFPLDVPRPEHLVNRSRSLRAAERFTAAGLSVIPHVNAFNQTDYECWRDFLKAHPHLSMVAQEFQTGLATRRRASWHIQQLCNIEQFLGRGLRMVAVGGRRHLPLLVGLSGVTITDSVPFIRTQKRRMLDYIRGKWKIHLTEEGQQLDYLLQHNVATYGRHVEIAIAALRRLGPVIPKLEEISLEPVMNSFVVSELQLSLWPDGWKKCVKGESEIQFVSNVTQR